MGNLGSVVEDVPAGGAPALLVIENGVRRGAAHHRRLQAMVADLEYPGR